MRCAEIATDICRRLESQRHWNDGKVIGSNPRRGVGRKKKNEAKIGTPSQEDSRRSHPQNDDNNGDIILSMTDADYKSIMFSYFRKLGDTTDEEEEKKVIDEAFNFFKISGDRFVRYQDWRHPALGFIPLDDKEARESKYNSIEVFVRCRKFST